MILDAATIARQPIFDAEHVIVGYEFFFRNEAGECDVSNPRAATAAVLVSLLNQLGLRASAGSGLLFVNIDRSILQTDLLLSAPAERFVFEVSAESILGNKEREMLHMYTNKGYRFALSNASSNPALFESVQSLLPYFEYVKFDMMSTDIETVSEMISDFGGKKLIAERIEIEELFEACNAMGFDLFQGYLFGELETMRHNRIDPKHLGVLKIYNLLMAETPIEQVADELEKHNELMLQLLQYINSTSMSDPYPNRSVKEILRKFGADKLKSWLLMIIYSKSSRTINVEKSELSKIVERRVDLMHTIIRMLYLSAEEEAQMFEKARLTAFLSLMEPILNVSMNILLDQIPSDQAIEDALLYNEGTLGAVLGLAVATEEKNGANAKLYRKRLDLTAEKLSVLEQK